MERWVQNGQISCMVRTRENQRSQKNRKMKRWRWRNHRQAEVVEVALVTDVYKV